MSLSFVEVKSNSIKIKAQRSIIKNMTQRSTIYDSAI